MQDRTSLQIPGNDFIKSPILASHGVLAEVIQYIPMDSQPVRIIHVRLGGKGPDHAKFFLTIETKLNEPTVIECPIRSEVYQVVRDVFEKAQLQTLKAEPASVVIPSSGHELAMLHCACLLAEDLCALPAAYKAREAAAYALGDAAGIALMVGDAKQTVALACKLREVLRIAPHTTIKPQQCVRLLNSIAPIIRAAVASGQMDVLDQVLHDLIPITCTLPDRVNARVDMSRFLDAITELFKEGSCDQITKLLEAFNNTKLQIDLLYMVTQVCTANGSAQAVNMCAVVVRSILGSYLDPSENNSEDALRVRAFNAAMVGNAGLVDKLIEQISPDTRSDHVAPWAVGFSIGMQIRAKDLQQPEDVIKRIEVLFNTRELEHEFCYCVATIAKGMLAANQGAYSEITDKIFWLLSEQYPELDRDVVFVSKRFEHQLISAQRAGNQGTINKINEAFVETVRSLAGQGEELIREMCEDLCSDVIVRDGALRTIIADTISSMLSSINHPRQYQFSRILLPDLLYRAGYKKQAMKITPPHVSRAGVHFMWQMRAEGAQAEATTQVLSEGLQNIMQEIEQWPNAAQNSVTDKREYLPIQPHDWGQIVEEAAALNITTLAHSAMVRALQVTPSWTVQEEAGLNEALLNGLIRRGYRAES